MKEKPPFLSIEEMEALTPNERVEAVKERIVTSWDEVPEDFRNRIFSRARSRELERREG